MSTVTLDGHGFLASGRRVILCSGTLAYTRLPRETWGHALDEMKRHGFNAVELPVVWREHEPREGAFDFSDALDLAHAASLAGERGMWVIVRVGVVAGEGWDFGGLPSWLGSAVEPAALRSADPAFLDRAGRFVSKACAQIKGLQARAETATADRCVIAVQCEHGYECGDQKVSDAYLGQLHRFIRESGVTVPVLNANNLYAYVDGQIETWRGGEDLLAAMRQMRTIDPGNPLLVSHLPVAPVSVWGETPEQTDRRTLARRLCEALAAGSSFNISDACAGSRTGFSAGRTDRGFACTDTSGRSLFDADGHPTELASAARRVCLFARSFAPILSAAMPDDDHACVATGSPGPSVVERRSAMGTVVFVFDDPSKSRGAKDVEILFRDGTRGAVSPGADGVGWALAGVSLGGRARLDLCTASAVALVGSVFVCTGPALSDATIAINGSSRAVCVPKGKSPEVLTVEGITVLVVNEASLDEIEIDEAGVGVPALRKRLLPDGSTEKLSTAKSAGSLRAPSLSGWLFASCAKHTDGSADRFAVIEGPSPMEALGVGEGYGWLSIDITRSAALRKKLAFPGAADRVHVYRDGAFVAITGESGDEPESITLPLGKGATRVGVLVDNLGRRSTGNMTGERKGLFEHAYETAPFKTTVTTTEGDPTEALRLRSPLFGVERGDLVDARRVSHGFTHRKKSPLFVTVAPLGAMAFVFLNGELLRVIDAGQADRFTLDQGTLNRGKNDLELAVLGNAAALLPEMRKAIGIVECTEAVTEGARWAYAKWEPPAVSEYADVAAAALKGKPASVRKGTPGWWKCSFKAGDAPRLLRLDTTGLSKGQVFVNGQNAGRFWASTHNGKSVEGSPFVPLPAGWLNATGENELLIFDEHGFSPAKAKLSYA